MTLDEFKDWLDIATKLATLTIAAVSATYACLTKYLFD